jgi:hypothetical protein
MNYEWMKYTPYYIPPQGLKVLCFTDGVAYVAIRFVWRKTSYWLPIPFTDSRFAHYNPPEYWCYIDFPPGFTGYWKFGVDDCEPLTLEELYEKDPESYNDICERFISKMIEATGKPLKKHEMDSIKRKITRDEKKSRGSQKI